MFLVHVNYLAVLLCGVLSMIVGSIWYGPLFGKEWMKMVGMTRQKPTKAEKSMMGPKMGMMFVSSLLMAYVLAHFIWYAAPGSVTLVIAVKTAIWAWLGFVLTAYFSKYLFSADKQQPKLLAIETGYYLVTLIGMGVIFGVLR